MEVKTYQKLDRYNLGCIHAEGFLKEQLERSRDGMGGHLYELEPGMIADPFIHKTYVPAWGNGDQSGWGAEISGNYWTGYIQLAYTLNDPGMIEKATWWVDTMMTHQRADGYLGTYYEDDAKIYEDYNAWGTGCAMRGLIAFYEATGREDVLNAVHRCMLWFCKNWDGDHKTSYAGVYIVEPMIFTYYHTGDERLLRFSEEYLEYLCDHDIFAKSYKSMLYDEFHYYSDHTAGAATAFRMPALVYSANGRQELLEASKRRIEQIRAKVTQLSGSPVSVSEYYGPVGSVNETEYCSYAFYNQAYSYMSYITGDACYGDYMEEMFYNGAQGARKKDERAIAYLSAPNQVYATMNSSNATPDMQVYAPCYPVSCCPVNAVSVVPEFIRGMILHDHAGNVYVAAYGPCSLNDGKVAFREETLYPFRSSVKFIMDCTGSFAMNLKIPAWSRGHRILVNGEDCTCAADTHGFAKVCREWNPGDILEITFEAHIEVIRVDDTDAAGKHPIAVKYGALLYSYHIPERWMPTEGRPMTKLPEGWSWYNVLPEYQEADAKDPHERIGLRRYQISWNVALDETLSEKDFTVEERTGGYVWEDPPIRLHTHAYKAPYLCATYPIRTLEPFDEYQYVTDKLELTLEPYGCTNLRISYFPKAKLK